MLGRKVLRVLFLAILIIVLLFIGARLAGYRPMKYPADVETSMYPTISPGDIWLCRMKHSYSSQDMQQGMIILFPKEGYKFLLTKRIIALENQIVAIHEEETFVNGKKIQEPHAFYSGEKPSGINGPHGTSEVETVKVPPGMLFVMGDNRDNSFDSRDPEFGFVEVKDIVGRPLLALWARDKRRIGRLIR